MDWSEHVKSHLLGCFDGREIIRPTSCEGRRGFAPILEVFQGGDVLVDDLVSCKKV